jgi:hypothetical protein
MSADSAQRAAAVRAERAYSAAADHVARPDDRSTLSARSRINDADQRPRLHHQLPHQHEATGRTSRG